MQTGCMVKSDIWPSLCHAYTKRSPIQGDHGGQSLGYVDFDSVVPLSA